MLGMASKRAVITLRILGSVEKNLKTLKTRNARRVLKLLPLGVMPIKTTMKSKIFQQLEKKLKRQISSFNEISITKITEQI